MTGSAIARSGVTTGLCAAMVLSALSLSACSSANSGCEVPITVSPSHARRGATVTVSSKGADCVGKAVRAAFDAASIYLETAGAKPFVAVRHINFSENGAFETTVTLPATAKPGAATATLSGLPCGDGESSCAGSVARITIDK